MLNKIIIKCECVASKVCDRLLINNFGTATAELANPARLVYW